MFWPYHMVEFSEMTRRFVRGLVRRFMKAGPARAAAQRHALRKAA